MVTLRIGSGLVPASGGGPGCIFGHFRLSVVRRSTRRSMGKVANYRRTNFLPRIMGKRMLRASPLSLDAASALDEDCSPCRAGFKIRSTRREKEGRKSRTKKRRRRTKFGSHWRPIRGRMRIKNTTINQTNVSINTLGAYLCDSGSIGLLWLSWYHFSSAALFRVLEHRLIVMNCISSYNNSPTKLKLSHE